MVLKILIFIYFNIKYFRTFKLHKFKKKIRFVEYLLNILLYCIIIVSSSLIFTSLIIVYYLNNFYLSISILLK